MGDRSVTSLLAVFVGGTLGTLARFGIDRALPHSTPGSLSVATVIVNVLGAFVLGVLVSGVWVRPAVPGWVKVAIGPGFLGSFTTLSAIALNFVAGVDEGKWVDSLLALSASLVFGLTAAWLGLKVGARAAATAGTS